MTQGFREFRVAQKVVESEIITSFYLEPLDGAPVWDVKPGQYITLRIPSSSDPVLKTYSVSNDPSETRHHRLTVKREADGLGSGWLHDHITPGDTVEVTAPRGVFVLDEHSPRPVLLLSGGVGQTPLVSMLHALRGTGRDVYFLHACENGRVHALRDEVLACADDRIRVRFVYRTPEAGDQIDATGMIDKAFLQKHLPLDDYDVYICGPTPFMVAMYQLVQALGVTKERIAYEFFGKAASLAAQPAPPVTAKPASRAAATVQALTFITNPDAWAAADEKPTTAQTKHPIGDVTFQASGTTAQWHDAAGSLLELAENAGLNPAFSCRSGICNSCKCGLVAGEIEYFEDPLIPPGPGQVLICCARPKGPIVLDI